MKKIIATVLAMVMALALCTVAFATTYGDLVIQAGGGWEKAGTGRYRLYQPCRDQVH